ncbi:E2 [Canine papillomavirus type 24]|nr:E2 [Canine papillomavirus type 24]
MENLKKRLDAIQNDLMNLYEEGGDRLSDQVLHWNLCRKENVLLHFARKAGVLRLGIQPVPSLRVTAERAKQAIEQELILQSLQGTPYAEERWTLQDTCMERWTTEPKNCLKKGATNVEVVFGGDRNNRMLYTMWKHVYYQDCDDKWCKVRSQVDMSGIWFWDNGYRRYYVDFGAEDRKYGACGQWDVYYNNEQLCPSESVTSTTPPTNPRIPALRPPDGEWDNGWSDPGAAGHKRKRSDEGPSKVGRPRTTVTPADSTVDTGTRTQEKEAPRPQESQARGVGGPAAEGGLRTQSPIGELPVRRRLLVSKEPGVRGPPSGPQPVPGGVGESVQYAEPPIPDEPPRLPYPPAEAIAPPPAGHPSIPAAAGEGPEEGPAPVGEGRLPVEGPDLAGPGHLFRQAGNSSPSVILLSGPCNTLKCLRYRIKGQLVDCYDRISTTWYWAGEGSERLGAARILVTFLNKHQRETFLDRVRLPQTVTLHTSIFD